MKTSQTYPTALSPNCSIYRDWVLVSFLSPLQSFSRTSGSTLQRIPTLFIDTLRRYKNTSLYSDIRYQQIYLPIIQMKTEIEHQTISTILKNIYYPLISFKKECLLYRCFKIIFSFKAIIDFVNIDRRRLCCPVLWCLNINTRYSVCMFKINLTILEPYFCTHLLYIIAIPFNIKMSLRFVQFCYNIKNEKCLIFITILTFINSASDSNCEGKMKIKIF